MTLDIFANGIARTKLAKGRNLVSAKVASGPKKCTSMIKYQLGIIRSTKNVAAVVNSQRVQGAKPNIQGNGQFRRKILKQVAATLMIGFVSNAARCSVKPCDSLLIPKIA